ncbi:MAG: hypothetical protein UY32_C0031G0002 [Candidatus Jorgensenbacteria bacterium GW2011_GWC1_48_8]|uniref:Uncharacterized protein n=1 Tax=Candidatus Jorgensenbacteria bacterium GW2011_GWC1_48_8 TaxID=1618666 RepID=A0A0G1XV87_9BACT|nr:MAG: hypothetical protein UY32_C0031G0002 [Candidatus Jorgensenbacteria bacterium GW2011_GWC1_48_8]
MGFDGDDESIVLDELGDVMFLSSFEYVYELLCEGVD